MFDEQDRPRAPQHPDAPTTATGREGSAFLVAIHEHLRGDLARLVRAVQVAVDDHRRATDARALLQDLTARIDPSAVASFCRQWCRVVEGHHRIEDAALFPDLAEADGDLVPVLERLSHEHVVLHEVLVRLDGLLVELLQGRAAATPEVAAALAALDEGLRSHLAYEERELLDAIRRLEVRV